MRAIARMATSCPFDAQIQPSREAARADALAAGPLWHEGGSERVLPSVSPQKLAKMAGTTRSKVDFFMKKFKCLGFIDDRDGLTVNRSLLSIVLYD